MAPVQADPLYQRSIGHGLASSRSGDRAANNLVIGSVSHNIASLWQ